MKVTRLNQRFAVSDESIYVNSDCTKIVKKTDVDVHSALAHAGQPFPITTAIRLGLLTEDEPIALEPLEKTDEAKALKEAPKNKAVSMGSTKEQKEE